ncbi:MAG: DUF2130 domain-containing protein [Holosporaceae bacterium]|jgi:hypothetical protein|nr:DUF2130 domain-containing protein [Holosporaceae bacterium]
MAEVQKIICPNCKAEISVDDILHAQIEASLRKEYEEKQRQDKLMFEEKEAELSKKAEEIESAQKNINKLVADAVAKEKGDLLKKTEEAETTKRNADIAVANAVKEQVTQREQEIQKQAKQDADNEKKQEIELLKSRERDLTEKLTIARNEQIQLMDEKRKLQDDKEAFEIEKRKQLEEARDQIKEDADKRALDKYQTIFAQKDKALTDALRANEELGRKLEQGSQQSQGEVAELSLEEELGKTFIYDVVEPVPKGIRGADIIQKVRSSVGKDCGQIIWEIKNTKAWSDSWIQKLKDDQREVHADVAIIISSVLPEDVKTFALRDGVWVCDIHLAIPLALAIRDKLEAITREKGFAIGKNEKMDILYQYLTGVQFRQRIEAIVEAFSSMRQDIEKEKRYFTKKWASQEMQIKKILTNTAGVYGDIDGMVSLPKIQSLELEYQEDKSNTSEII